MKVGERLFVTFSVVVILFGLAVAVAHANPTYFTAGVSTNNAASTSPTYMTPGTATSTTPVYDSYALTTGGVQYKADSAGLLVQYIASSTATVFNENVEYSQDGIDWYRNFALSPSQMSTTTWPFALTTPFSSTYKFASSSLDGASFASSSQNMSSAAMLVPTPFRFLRVYFTVSGGNGAVWAQIVPTKERP